MRVCHIVPSLEERHGGPSKSVRALANAQAKVENLNKQIADKEAQAQKIYADTETAFDAADVALVPS